MRIEGGNIPTNPYHIARAYGLQNARAVSGIRPAQQTAELKAPAQTALPSAAQKLVAAVVPGRVDFSGPAPQPSAGPLAFYRHPADKNAAATSVSLGKSLDISG